MENEIYKKVYIHSEADLPPKYGKYMTHAVGMGVHLVYFDSENKNKWGKLYDWYLLPLPSVSREKAEEVLNKHSGVMLYKDTIIADNQQYYSRDFCISLMLEFATPSPQSPEPSDHKTYYCSVCHKVPVDAENGFDTCFDCVSKI